MKTHLLDFYFDFSFFLCSDANIISGIMALKTISKVAITQAQALPYILEANANLSIAMTTGTGKTLLYGIAAISKVNVQNEKPQVLVVCATYEAAIQTQNVLARLAIFTGAKVGLATSEIGLASIRKSFMANTTVKK